MLSRTLPTVGMVVLLTLALPACVSAVELSQTTSPGQTASFSEASSQFAAAPQHKGITRLPDIFICRPEPRYCQPEAVCIRQPCRPSAKYCRPESVCWYPICRPEAWLCKPEPVCRDPEPRCCDQPRPTKAKP
jgi:hypothetical protein